MSNIRHKLDPWFEARKRFRLSDAQVQMARELGMNPDKLGKLNNHKQEPWKAPLPEFIENCYYKSFRKDRPDNVRSLEQVIDDHEGKREKKRVRKEQKREAENSGSENLPF